jgi:hypothetical protein
MTTTSILVLSGIVSAFSLFAVGLAWGDFYSRKRSDDQTPVAEQKPSVAPAIVSERKAA